MVAEVSSHPVRKLKRCLGTSNPRSEASAIMEGLGRTTCLSLNNLIGTKKLTTEAGCKAQGPWSFLTVLLPDFTAQ